MRAEHSALEQRGGSLWHTSQWLTLPICASVCQLHTEEEVDLEHWFSKCGSCTSSISIAWELVICMNYLALSQTS